jgi:hypothetical protein
MEEPLAMLMAEAMARLLDHWGSRYRRGRIRSVMRSMLA